mgnify:CR=1 FL=1
MAKAIAQFTITDINDVNIQLDEPVSKILNMLWLDTSSVPNILKRWNGSEWEIISDPDKVSNEALNDVINAVSAIGNAVEGKAPLGELEALQAEYEARVAQEEANKAATEAALTSMESRKLGIIQYLADNAAVWNFINTSVTMTEEGIFIGNKLTEMGLLMQDDRISFMDKGTEVAYISNKTMQITHGIFVESAIIGKHKQETIPGTDISVFTYVG